VLCGAATAFGVLNRVRPRGALAVPIAICGRSALRRSPVVAYLLAGTCFVTIVGAWLVPALVASPDYVHDFIWVHNVQRYSVDADLFHPEPFALRCWR
jgi:hypothetical protein